jgi:hypothetical protein
LESSASNCATDSSGLLPPQNADDVVRQSARSSCAVIRGAKKAADITCFESSVYSDQTRYSIRASQPLARWLQRSAAPSISHHRCASVTTFLKLWIVPDCWAGRTSTSCAQCTFLDRQGSLARRMFALVDIANVARHRSSRARRIARGPKRSSTASE